MKANMDVVSINRGKETFSVCPKPPIYLTDVAKKYYSQMGTVLVRKDGLKETYLNALEIYAEAMAQWYFAVTEIKKRNKNDYGSGYIQVFKTGAKNISVEMTVKNNAEDTLLKCFKLFGLDPKSEKELKGTTSPGQLNFFEEMMKLKNG